MKLGNYIAIGGAIAAIMWVNSRKNLLISTVFTLKGVSVGGSLLNPQLTIQLAAINTSKNSQDINSIIGQIFLNDTILIGNVYQPVKQTIAANATSVIELPVNVKLAGVLDTISQLISRKNGKFSFVGTINVFGINVPVNQSYTL
jgi:hypothetical protein